MSSIDIRWEELSNKEKVLATLVVGGLYVVECVSNLSYYVYEKGKVLWKIPWKKEENMMVYMIRYNGDTEEETYPIIFYG